MPERSKIHEPQINDDVELNQALNTTSASGEVEARVYTSTEKLEIGQQALDLIDDGLSLVQAAKECGITGRVLSDWLRFKELATYYDSVTIPKIELAVDVILTEDLSVLEVLQLCKLSPSVFWRRLREPQFEAKYHEVQACLVGKICQVIKAGASVDRAAEQQGISDKTFRNWLKKDPGLLALYEGVKITTIKTIYELMIESHMSFQEAISQQGLDSQTFWQWLADSQFEVVRHEIQACLVEKICHAIQAEVSVITAIEQQGIGFTTFYKWLRKDPILLEFYKGVKTS